MYGSLQVNDKLFTSVIEALRRFRADGPSALRVASAATSSDLLMRAR
jgi:hypothetical protein